MLRSFLMIVLVLSTLVSVALFAAGFGYDWYFTFPEFFQKSATAQRGYLSTAVVIFLASIIVLLVQRQFVVADLRVQLDDPIKRQDSVDAVARLRKKGSLCLTGSPTAAVVAGGAARWAWACARG